MAPTEQYKVARQFPPAANKYRKKWKIPKLGLKHDNLVKKFYATYPEESIRLIKFRNADGEEVSKTTGIAFVERQIELMKQGMSEHEAFNAVDTIFRAEVEADEAAASDESSRS